MIAAATPDANTFLQFWLILGLLGSVLGNVVTPIIIIFLNFRKQRREVSFPIETISKEDFKEHVSDNERQRGILHKRIDDVITDYNEKFQNLPSQIIALLHNAGVINKK